MTDPVEQKKHVEKAWVVKGIPKRGKPYFIDAICLKRKEARFLLNLYPDSDHEKLSVVRVEIREL